MGPTGQRSVPDQRDLLVLVPVLVLVLVLDCHYALVGLRMLSVYVSYSL